MKEELRLLNNELLENPRKGVLIRENTYKIRLAVKSKGKGKSGGLRIITHVIELDIIIEENVLDQEFTVILLSIYDKSEMENISEKQLRNLIAEIVQELEEENEGPRSNDEITSETDDEQVNDTTD